MSAVPRSPLPAVAGGAVSTYQSLDSLTGEAGGMRAALDEHAGLAAAAPTGAQTHDADLWGCTVKLLRGTDLMIGDTFTRSSDPYVCLTVDGVTRKSRILKKTLQPEFHETFSWVFEAKPQKLTLDVFDHDQIGEHDSLGSVTLDLMKMGLNHGHSYTGSVRLEGKDVKSGKIELTVECAPIPNVVGRASNELLGIKSVEDIVSLIELKVVGARDLGRKYQRFEFLKMTNDPFATVTFGMHSFKTAVVPNNNSPTWNQVCPLWITKSANNSSAVLKVTVYDHERIGKSVVIGNAYLRPSMLKMGHLYDVELPLTTDDAETDAQLNVLMADLKVDHEEAQIIAEPRPGQSADDAVSAKPAAANKSDAVGTASSDPSVSLATAPTCVTLPAGEKQYGFVHLTFTVKPRQQVEEEFYEHLVDQYDTDGNKNMSLDEILHCLTAVGAKLTEEEVTQAFELADKDNTGQLTVKQLAALFRTDIFEKKGVLRHLYAVILYGPDALDSLLMKGCLTGSNTNLAPDTDPTVDNEGVKIMVMERESGLIVRENIPSYIKSALVLLNRTWMGKIAQSRIRGTIKNLTERQGRKMDSRASVKDIPNFVKIHRLNLDDVELPLDQYKTFNQFFSRRLKPGARSCFAEGDDSIAVSPADCRLMVFRSLDESQRLWIKGKHFTLGNLFGDWDKDGKMAAKFNGGELAIARLAPQDYHRFHMPVTGVFARPRHLISGTYHTVSPIAVRKNVDVYTENKRCIVAVETAEFGLVLMIAIAATMVGSMGFVCACNPKPNGDLGCVDGKCMIGKKTKKFDELGFFRFGGSTVLVLFQPGAIQFDADLLNNSNGPLETLVKVGMSIGKSTGKYATAAKQ